MTKIYKIGHRIKEKVNSVAIYKKGLAFILFIMGIIIKIRVLQNQMQWTQLM